MRERVSRTAGCAGSRPEAGNLWDHRALDVFLPDRRCKHREVLPHGRRLLNPSHPCPTHCQLVAVLMVVLALCLLVVVEVVVVVVAAAVIL